MDSATTAMTAVDAAWYYIDDPANLAQINGILLTREPLDFARVKELYRRLLLKFRRFRQRVVEAPLPLMAPTWTDDPDFQIARHVLHRTLPRPAHKATLMEILGELVSSPLERLRKAKENMDALKQSPEAVAVLGLFNVLGYLPKPVEDLAIDRFDSKASMVMTNEAGPRETLHVTGVPIDRIMF
jgi:hypothetical protein